jgi:hypothetical protein
MSVECVRFYTLCAAMLDVSLTHADKRAMLREMKRLVVFVE